MSFVFKELVGDGIMQLAKMKKHGMASEGRRSPTVSPYLVSQTLVMKSRLKKLSNYGLLELT